VRGIAGAVIALILFAGCTSDEPSPSTSGSPVPVVIDDLAPLVVANGSEVSQYVNGESQTIHRLSDGDAALALSGPDAEGIVVQQRFDDRSNIVHVVDGRTETVVENAGLLDSALVDGAPTVVYATCNDAMGEERQGDIVLFDITSERKRALADACAIEYGVGRVSFGGGVFVVSATSDLTEVFRFYEPDGSLVEDRPNPTKDLPYNEPPFMSDAVLEADGSSLAYLEAPDVSGLAGGGEKRSGRFNAVVVDQGTGKETARVALPDPATQYQRLDYDGRWIVLSQGADEPVRVVDISADDAEAIEIAGARGVASIMRN
jgi:hypothetical protein